MSEFKGTISATRISPGKGLPQPPSTQEESQKKKRDGKRPRKKKPLSKRIREGLRKNLLSTSIAAILFALFMGLIVVPSFQEFNRFQARPQVKMGVSELTGTVNGSWYGEVYWREGYHLYNFSVQNVGQSAAEEFKLSALVPGAIFAIRSSREFFLGMEISSDLVAIKDQGVFDPVDLGRLLPWQPLGKWFELTQGGPRFSVHCSCFDSNSTLWFLVYFSDNAVPGQPPPFSSELSWVYYGKTERMHWENVTSTPVPQKQFNAWPYNPYELAVMNDTTMPYAHADADPQLAGIQASREAKANEAFDINVVFDYTNTTHPYGAIAICVFPEWYDSPITLYQGTKEHNYFNWTETINAPAAAGNYSIRIIQSEYDYPTYFNCSDTGGGGFELTIHVTE